MVVHGVTVLLENAVMPSKPATLQDLDVVFVSSDKSAADMEAFTQAAP